MRILAIRGRNLTALAGDFQVDFEDGPLSGAGLFAITGPTGAGKSTLLDALCLALYDRFPRLENAAKVAVGQTGADDALHVKGTDPRTILRHGEVEGFAEVDFAGRDGGRYQGAVAGPACAWKGLGAPSESRNNPDRLKDGAKPKRHQDGNFGRRSPHAQD